MELEAVVSSHPHPALTQQYPLPQLLPSLLLLLLLVERCPAILANQVVQFQEVPELPVIEWHRNSSLLDGTVPPDVHFGVKLF